MRKRNAKAATASMTHDEADFDHVKSHCAVLARNIAMLSQSRRSFCLTYRRPFSSPKPTMQAARTLTTPPHPPPCLPFYAFLHANRN